VTWDALAKGRWGPAALVVAVALVSHAPGLGAGFVYDDNEQVVENPRIRDLGNVPRFFLTSTLGPDATGSSNYYRPAMNVAYTLEYAVLGLRPWAWHLLGLLLHALNAWLLLMLAGVLLSRRHDGGTWGALAAALLFAVHPVTSEAVYWVACQTELLYAGCALGAVLLVARGAAGLRVPAWLTWAGLLCKETAVVTPGLVATVDGEPRLRRYAPFAVAVAAYGVMRLFALEGVAPREPMHPYLDGFQHVLNGVALLAQHLAGLAWPAGLSPFHPLDAVESPLEPRFLGALAVVAAATWGVTRAWRFPLGRLGVALVFLPLLPVLYLPVLGRNPFAERYLYLPVAGLSLVFGWAVTALLARGRRDLAVGCVSALVLAGGVASFNRGADWRDDVTLFSSAARSNPGNYFAWKYLGGALLRRDQPGPAVGALQRSVAANLARRHPDPRILWSAQLALGEAFSRLGRHQEAVATYQDALAHAPHDALAHAYLALSLIQVGRREDALRSLHQAQQRAPASANPVAVLNNVGAAYQFLGQDQDALEAYRQAAALAPGDPLVRENLRNLQAPVP
jgi:tetratricopeptide (TPR) repeat protein